MDSKLTELVGFRSRVIVGGVESVDLTRTG